MLGNILLCQKYCCISILFLHSMNLTIPSHSKQCYNILFVKSIVKMINIGFLGGGKMAYAMAKGFITSGLTKAEDLIASVHPLDVKSKEDFESLGGKAVTENQLVVSKSDLVLISVKPSVVKEVLDEISKNKVGCEKKIFVSIAMGVTIENIENWLPEKCRVIRVMPNTPALVGKGAALLVPGTYATKEDVEQVKKLFEAVGTCDVGNEKMLNAVTALSGSGPAYVYLMIEALSDGGVKMGLPRDLSQKLAAQTVAGAAAMVMDTGVHPAVLRDNVTSPAGSTAYALHHLEVNGFKGAVIGAVEAATKRCESVASGSK